MLPNVQRTDAADHVPVLAEEVRELLDVQPGETVVDATFGAGGHSRLLAADLRGSGKLVAIDRDPTVRPYFDRMRSVASSQGRSRPPPRSTSGTSGGGSSPTTSTTRTARPS